MIAYSGSASIRQRQGRAIGSEASKAKEQATRQRRKYIGIGNEAKKAIQKGIGKEGIEKA